MNSNCENRINTVPSDEMKNVFSAASSVAAHFAKCTEKPKCYIRTFGCQQNEADSERMAALCIEMGYELTEIPDEAKLILVNTCAIREHAEKKALSIIGQYKHIKDRDPEVLIGIGGCMVTQKTRADKLKMSYPYVSFTFDTGALHLLASLILLALDNGDRRFVISDEYRIPEDLPLYRPEPFKAWLSVMYGCNNFCSYCIVPYVRGRERSRDPEKIIEEARYLVSTGAHDITLLGQNVNSYGSDLDGSIDFATLIHRICAIEGDFRLRFMTSHPKDASDALIDTMAAEEKMIHHFHLPLQSGSDRILKNMNRHYDTARYLEIIDKLKDRVPDISITSDIIVGFPGETEDDFASTLDVIRRVRYDMIFSFIYSPRAGTKAAQMTDQIPPEVSSARFERLLETANNISLERNSRFVGRTVRALCEEVSRTDLSMLTFRSDSPRPIHAGGSKDMIGSFADIKITEADTFSLMGEIIKR